MVAQVFVGQQLLSGYFWSARLTQSYIIQVVLLKAEPEVPTHQSHCTTLGVERFISFRNYNFVRPNRAYLT